ncbi:MAG: ATP-binding protein [Synergistaceae bacterium]|nr:ATP-binding protein [Synergistaceae bacterium]
MKRMVPQAELLEILFESVQEFAPHREEIRRIFLKDLGENRGMRFFVALNEAVNNALIHGKGASDEKVRLSIRDGGDRISAHVKSCGGNFRHDMIADGAVFDDKTKESGRGVQIILHVVDGCKLTKSGDLVSMFMRKGGDEPEVGFIE